MISSAGYLTTQEGRTAPSVTSQCGCLRSILLPFTQHRWFASIISLTFVHEHASQGYTHALYDLATYPEIVGPLREEVETVIQAEGWTKDAMGKLHKLDSFMKESQRYNGVGACKPILSCHWVSSHEHLAVAIMGRKVLKDFTFSNGTVVPAGNVVAVASYATHHDEVRILPTSASYLW